MGESLPPSSLVDRDWHLKTHRQQSVRLDLKMLDKPVEPVVEQETVGEPIVLAVQ
jgi:hypothetical protein